MNEIARCVKQFLISDDGPTAVEYAVMLGLIVMVCIATISAVGGNTATKLQESADMLT